VKNFDYTQAFSSSEIVIVLMACADDKCDVSTLSGSFYLNSVTVYNLVNIGRDILNSIANTYNFCCELKLLSNKRKCPRCRRELQLRSEPRYDHKTPVVFRCHNKNCKKQYISIRDGSFFDNSNLSLEQVLVVVYVFSAKITAYERIIHECQLSSESKFEFAGKRVIFLWQSVLRTKATLRH